jgi:hypothetical protein
MLCLVYDITCRKIQNVGSSNAGGGNMVKNRRPPR